MHRNISQMETDQLTLEAKVLNLNRNLFHKKTTTISTTDFFLHHNTMTKYKNLLFNIIVWDYSVKVGILKFKIFRPAIFFLIFGGRASLT